MGFSAGLVLYWTSSVLASSCSTVLHFLNKTKIEVVLEPMLRCDFCSGLVLANKLPY